MMTIDATRVKLLTKLLSYEFFKALGFKRDGLLSRTFWPLVSQPIRRFSEICVGFDCRVEELGFQSASQWILPNFAKEVFSSGTATIPRQGSLLIAANHPGAYDSLAITSSLPRDDIKIIVNLPLDFISELPATYPHFLYAPHDINIRMNVVRNAIKHLKNGGALLMFASGRIDPDPASMPGAEIELNRWSRSLDFFLRKTPDTNLLVTIVSGILDPKYVNHFFTKFRKERPDKQRISEFLQVMHQMLKPGQIQQRPRVSFGKPLLGKDLINRKHKFGSLEIITEEAKKLLKFHL